MVRDGGKLTMPSSRFAASGVCLASSSSRTKLDRLLISIHSRHEGREGPERAGGCSGDLRAQTHRSVIWRSTGVAPRDVFQQRFHYPSPRGFPWCSLPQVNQDSSSSTRHVGRRHSFCSSDTPESLKSLEIIQFLCTSHRCVDLRAL